MKRIQSKLHRIGTFEVCKTCLSCFDNKICIFDFVLIIKYAFDVGINSLAYFLKDLRSQLKMWLYCKELDLKTKTAF